MIIGITGQKGVGKTTMAFHIASRFGGFQLFYFAKPLKYSLSYLTGLEIDYFTKPELKEEPLPEWNNMTPRRMMQLFGTEVARHIHSDFWVRAAEVHMPKNTDVLIDDVRFPNEANWVKKQGGTIVKIIGGPPRLADGHASETLFGIYPDHMIENKFNDSLSTLPEFYDKIDQFMESIYTQE